MKMAYLLLLWANCPFPIFYLLIIIEITRQQQDMKSTPLLLLVVLLSTALITAQAAITHLNDKNFIKKVNESPFTLIYFYSSTCKFCKEFTPKFEKISKNSQLISLNVSFAKMDAPSYQNFTKQYQVHTYPTIAVFIKDIPHPIYYRKQREEQPIVDFITKIIQPFDQPQLANQIAQLNPQQIVANKFAVFKGKRDSNQFKIWDIIAKRDGYIEWTFLEDQTNKVVIGNHQFTDFTNFTQLQEQVEAVYAKLHRVTEQSWLKMADKKRFTIVYINKFGNKKTRQLLQKLAVELPNVHFLQIHDEQDDYKQAIKFFGVNDEENIISVDKLYDATYIAPSPYTEAGLRDFIGKAREHKLQLYRKTEKSDKPNKLTRSNYEQKMSTKQDVLLFLYDRSEDISKELMKLFEFLLVKLRDNKNLLLLRCDVKLNQIEEKLEFPVQHTPRLVFFRNKMKDYPIHFQGKTISPQTVIEFIMENTTFDFEDHWAEL